MSEPHGAITRVAKTTPLFRNDSTYLVTGGLRGFGLTTAEWIVDNGARHIVLAGRGGVTTTETYTIAQTRTDDHGGNESYHLYRAGTFAEGSLALSSISLDRVSNSTATEPTPPVEPLRVAEVAGPHEKPAPLGRLGRAARAPRG